MKVSYCFKPYYHVANLIVRCRCCHRRHCLYFGRYICVRACVRVCNDSGVMREHIWLPKQQHLSSRRVCNCVCSLCTIYRSIYLHIWHTMFKYDAHIDIGSIVMSEQASMCGCNIHNAVCTVYTHAHLQRLIASFALSQLYKYRFIRNCY